MSKEDPGVGGFVVTGSGKDIAEAIFGPSKRDPILAVKQQQVRNLKRLHSTSQVIEKLLPKTAAVEAAKREGYRAEAKEKVAEIRKMRAKP